MALSIDWGDTNTIYVPQADLTLVSGTLYDLDTDAFRLELKSLEDDEQGMVWPDTHIHNPEVTISGTTYARQVIILAPYTVKFEDTGSAYTVRTIGSNNNILDLGAGILTPTPLVTYFSTNAAGLVSPAGQDALTDQMLDIWTRLFGGRLYVNPTTGKEVIKDSLGSAYSEADIYSDDGVTAYDGTTGVARRDEHVKP